MRHPVEAIRPWQISVPERLLAGAGTATVVGLFGYMLLIGLSGEVRHRIEQSLVLLDLREAPPPPIERPKARVEPHKAKASGAASPRNLKNQAAEIVSPPPPPIMVRVPPPVISAPKPGTGMASAAGASDRPGPGEGAGGIGNGTGSGDRGNGDGDGGIAPRQIGGKLRIGDLPLELRQPGMTRTVEVRYQVEADGRVSGCDAIGSSGDAAIDRLTCGLIEQRFVFRPSRDAHGVAVRSTVEESHSWIIERSAAPQP